VSGSAAALLSSSVTAAVRTGSESGGRCTKRGAEVDFQRQQRQRRQKQAARLLRPEVGRRREWVPAPPRAGGAGDLHGHQPHADPDVPALPLRVPHVVQELGGVVPVVDLADLRRLERDRRRRAGRPRPGGKLRGQLT
jgi:hypothetical protein